jgi:DNA gyrase subunit B
MSRVAVGPSRLETLWDKMEAPSGRNKVREEVRLSDLEAEDLAWFENRADFVLTPEKNADKGIARHLAVDDKLMTLLGFYLAEGSCSARNGVRLSLGKGNQRFCGEMADNIELVFGHKPTLYEREDRVAELKLVNRVAALAWENLFGFHQANSATKRIPDLAFNVSESLRLEFLRGYLLGDGTVHDRGLSFTTSSYDLASGLMYLLSSLGVVSSSSQRQPDGVEREARGEPCVTRLPYWTISVSSREDLSKIERVWSSHANAEGLRQWVASTTKSGNRRFERIDGDLIALPITEITPVEASNGMVYDFSVQDDENFVAGMGGLCCHNTDADIDGAHIRTLLLTFFYRQMPDLITRGHVFIAQPPLYSVKLTNKAKPKYLKDEAALSQYLFDLAIEGTAFSNAGRVLGKDEIEAAAKAHFAANDCIAHWGRFYDESFLEILCENAWTIDSSTDATRAASLASISAAYAAHGAKPATMSWGKDASGADELQIHRVKFGNKKVASIPAHFFEGDDFAKIKAASALLAPMRALGWNAKRSGMDSNFGTLKSMIETVFADVRKNMTIQRYKGLGEMNPEQLHETTLDVKVRSLLKVTIDDAIAADKTFQMLMGDDVPPRRQFIEENALGAKNIDT